MSRRAKCIKINDLNEKIIIYLNLKHLNRFLPLKICAKPSKLTEDKPAAILLLELARQLLVVMPDILYLYVFLYLK